MNDKVKLLISVLTKSRKPIYANKLKRMIGVKDLRILRKIIQEARMEGYFIASSNEGYFIGSKKDFERYISYAYTILKTYFTMLKKAGNDKVLKLEFKKIINMVG